MIEKTQDFAACLAIRLKVFVEEQHVPLEEERDAYDDEAMHFLAWLDGEPVGTARVILKGEIGKIGRVAVLPQARGTGLGAGLIRAALDALRQQPGVDRAVLGAQTHAIGFYEKLGFAAYGPQYLDAGIPHRDMALDLK